MMGETWSLIPSIALKYNTALSELVAEAARIDPFVSLPWLLQANDGPSGILLNRVGKDFLLPAKFRNGLCLGLGGYVHPELGTPIVALGERPLSEEVVSDLPAWLISRNIHAVFVEGGCEQRGMTVLSTALETAGWAVGTYPGRKRPSATLPVRESDTTFDEMLRGLNAKEFRSLRAARRKLEAAGQVDIATRVGTMSDADVAFCRDVEQRSWKAGKGIFSRKNYETTRLALQSCRTVTSLLRLDGIPIAWDIDILHGDTLYSYNRAFDGVYRRLAPGKVLHYTNLEVAWKRGVRQVELLGDTDPFKEKIADSYVQRGRIVAFSNRMSGRILRLGHACHVRCKPLAKKLRRLF
jgi:hypothetical protein